MQPFSLIGQVAQERLPLRPNQVWAASWFKCEPSKRQTIDIQQIGHPLNPSAG
jgi:hypothetical protein